MCWTHKQLEELEDPLVCEDVKCVSCDWVNDRQAVNFVFDERVNGVKQAATQHSDKKTLKNRPSDWHADGGTESKGGGGTWHLEIC